MGQTDIVPLSDEEATIAILERSVTGLWDVVNHLTRLRRTKRANFRITVFGSARLQPGTPAYEKVRERAMMSPERTSAVRSTGSRSRSRVGLADMAGPAQWPSLKR